MTFDALVIGGGFYGSSVASYLAAKRGLRRVLLVERESALLARASTRNQARIHSGYHYPRSFTTAYRSRVNVPRFMRDYSSAIHTDLTALYAVARRNSRVTCAQFERFCRSIGAPLRKAARPLAELFEPRLIEAVFEVEEYVFDARVLAEIVSGELESAGVETWLGAHVERLFSLPSRRGLRAEVVRGGRALELEARFVFNCTYSGLRQFTVDEVPLRAELKHELSELALVQVPAALSGYGFTVMDGPFFSILPCPSRGLHSLSHVRYTPHEQFWDGPGQGPKLEQPSAATRVDRMLRDVQRYLPSASGFDYVASMFEIKTLLSRNETDDGRPILYEKHATCPRYYAILGGKIDNIYDVLARLDREDLSGERILEPVVARFGQGNHG